MIAKLLRGAIFIAFVIGRPQISIDFASADERALRQLRHQMVAEEVAAAGVRDPRVLQSLRDTPRHEFVPDDQKQYAYYDMALPIGESQTISPPFVVAYMTEQLQPQPDDVVLEIGTGSGYQAAVLSPLVAEVYSIEIVEGLGRTARATLERLGYENVHTRIGDGYQGWPEKSPFDKIIVTCSPEHVPQALVDQLRDGGQIIIPVGERYQQTIYRLTKRGDALEREALLPTFFVPMTGTAESLRETLPDSANPKVVNGDFENRLPDSDKLASWHYQRQLYVIEDGEAPSGESYVALRNREPGRGAQALQGIPIDGREVGELKFEFAVRGRRIRQGQKPEELPVVAVTFYDDNRGMVAHRWIGPWQGTFRWKRVSRNMRVPEEAREAVLRIGLFGGIGEIAFDDLSISVSRTRND